jgi:hypothetical protein
MITRILGLVNTVLVGSTGYQVTVDENGKLGVVQHSHPDAVNLHFHDDSIATTKRYVFIDVSDTERYKHSGTNYIHFENLDVQVDPDTNADYIISLIYLENVGAGGADAHVFKRIVGNKKVGQKVEFFQNPYPNGIRAVSDFHVSSKSTLNDPTYAATERFFSTHDTVHANVAPVNGAIILEVIMNADSINLDIDAAYHGH